MGSKKIHEGKSPNSVLSRFAIILGLYIGLRNDALSFVFIAWDSFIVVLKCTLGD